MAQAGDPEIVIKSPASGNTLGPNFSVYGSCSAIGTASNPTITVSLYNGPAYVTGVNATQNIASKTWEAVFSNIAPIIDGNASIRVKCSLMANHLTVSPLTISGDNLSPITNPTEGGSYQSWGEATGKGDNSNSNNAVEVYLTQAGHSFGDPQTTSVGLGGSWSASLQNLVPQNTPGGQNFVLHTLVRNPGLIIIQRGASCYFSVGG